MKNTPQKKKIKKYPKWLWRTGRRAYINLPQDDQTKSFIIIIVIIAILYPND